MSKMMAFDQEAREAMRRGVAKLARAVKVTLGPKGRNVILQKSFGSPTVTKDGVTVAKEIDLEDVYENMGARMVREVASKTSDVAGDGTTTATVLAEAIFREGIKMIAASFTSCAPRFSNGSSRSMSSATVTPSLVTLGEPQPLSSTALRPRGPSVLLTARASFDTPASSGWRASSSNTICFATSFSFTTRDGPMRCTAFPCRWPRDGHRSTNGLVF